MSNKIVLCADLKKAVVAIAREAGFKIDVQRMDLGILKKLEARYERHIEEVADKLADHKMMLLDLIEVFEEGQGGAEAQVHSLH